MQICCGKSPEKKKPKSNLLIQNQELLRLRLTHEEKVFYTELFYDNAVGGKVLKNNFLPLLGMLGTQIAEEFAERIFLAFSSNKKEITLCEYLKYIDIYHYGDDRERCRVTCKLMDKKSTGIIKLEDFRSYINLIMNAVQKVNGGSEGSLMSDQDIRDLFYHISKDKESFTYQEFEDLYKEKPELVSWFDYFKNNKEDMLLIINQNVKNLLNMINEFLSSFMNELFKVLEHEDEKELDLSVFIQKVYYYSNELEKVRKKFLKKISKFNIRTTFDKLQNNNKNQKTTDLINALQKKIFNDEQNGYNKNLSSSFMFSAAEPERKNEISKISKGRISGNFLQSFKTINVGGDKNKVGAVNNISDNIGMAKFFKKIKNNLERTLSKKSNIDKNNATDNEEKEKSSSEEENEENNEIDSNKNGNFSKSIINSNNNNVFAQNFIKQQTMFGNKFFKFGNGKKDENKDGLYKSSMQGSLSSKKRTSALARLNPYDKIDELDEIGQIEPENSARHKSQDFSNKIASYSLIKNNLFEVKVVPITSMSKGNNSQNNDKNEKCHASNHNKHNTSKELISEEVSLYDKSDYEKTLRLGTIIESESNLETSNDKKNEEKKFKSKTSKKIRRVKSEEEKNNLTTKQSDKVLNISFSNNNNNKKENKNNNNNEDNEDNNNKKKKLNSDSPNSIPQSRIKKYILRISNLEKKSNGLNQLLFCARVAIENALDVCQTLSSCYKWIGENYLESQIKKVIKEAKLKEKAKEDKEKYGNIGNVPKKETPAKKKIIRASDQSFKLLLNMIMGIQIAVQSIPNFHIKNNEDLSKYMTNMLYSIQTINFGKKKEEVFILKEFAGIIFNNIRLYLGYDKDDFIASISPQDFITELMISNQTIFEELCSTGKSGSLFYYTRDGKFIVKTIKKDEYKFIKQILPDYFHHLKTYPLSLLPKFLGCYVLTRKVKKKRDKIYFIVMINVFATSKHIHIRYDLKGSKIGRRVLTGKRDAEIMAKGDLALKDLDLEKRKEKMYIGEKNDILLKQIKNDADFLCKIKANDYSLLLGIHYINKEKKNLQKVSSTNLLNQNKTNIEDSFLKESSLSDKSCDSRQEKLKALIDFEDGGIISETGNEVYFVGIIDILTRFGFKKKCEHFFKMLRYCSNNMSCTPPEMYRNRFVNYMSTVIQKSSNFNSIKNPLIERFKKNNNKNNNNNNNNNNNSTNNTSNNILIQNNTNNFYNIINNNNNITVKSIDENNRNPNTLSSLSNKENNPIAFKYTAEEVIKEESELEKASFVSSQKDNNDIKTSLKNSILGHQSEGTKE